MYDKSKYPHRRAERDCRIFPNAPQAQEGQRKRRDRKHEQHAKLESQASEMAARPALPEGRAAETGDEQMRPRFQTGEEIGFRGGHDVSDRQFRANLICLRRLCGMFGRFEREAVRRLLEAAHRRRVIFLVDPPLRRQINVGGGVTLNRRECS